MKKNRFWLLVLALTSIEQLIKIVINSSYLDSTVHLIGNFVYFKPMFNRDYSWFNSLLGLGISKGFHIVTVALMLVLIIMSYYFLKNKKVEGLPEDLAYSFLISGAVCSLIDKVFWDGSLDYILFRGFFTFDLKDVYINVFIGSVVLMLILDYKGIRKEEDSQIVREFLSYLKEKLTFR